MINQMTMKHYGGQTIPKIQRTKNAPEGGILHCTEILAIKIKQKTKSLRRGQHTGYETNYSENYKKVQQKALHTEENKRLTAILINQTLTAM